MRSTARLLLVCGAAALLAYPLWGLLDPSSYAVELKEHYAFADGASSRQIRSSAAMLWLSNGVLAIAFISIARYIKQPRQSAFATFAGFALITYPFVRTFIEVWSGLNLTSHIETASISIELSSEKAFYIVYGMAIIGIASAWSEINKSSKKDKLMAVSSSSDTE